MKNLLFAIAFLLVVPALRAQQTDNSTQPPAPAASQPSTPQENGQNNPPAAIRPGHPLDPADVDVLTGKRDRELEAARRKAATPAMVGGYGDYGTYGDYYWMSGRLGSTWDIPILPLTRITNPFFFGLPAPRGFGWGGLGRGGR
jgi:hypothetical protein